MKRCCATIVCLLAGTPGAFAQKRTMVDNLNYRASGAIWGTSLRLLWRNCDRSDWRKAAISCSRAALTNPQKWHRDPLYFRFGHKHPFSTIGCRERTSPSLHVVFYKLDDGSRQAWIHFDLYSPGNFIGHAGEVVQNRLTSGRTSQADVYRSLVSFRSDPNQEIPAPRYDYRAHAREYVKTTFGPSAVASSIATGGVGAFIDLTTEFGSGFERYANHVEGNLARHTIQQTIEFGAAAFLKQDESFAVSHEQRIPRKSKGGNLPSLFCTGPQRR